MGSIDDCLRIEILVMDAVACLMNECFWVAALTTILGQQIPV